MDNKFRFSFRLAQLFYNDGIGYVVRSEKLIQVWSCTCLSRTKSWCNLLSARNSFLWLPFVLFLRDEENGYGFCFFSL